MNKRKSKFLTFLFSFIPGLGHVYLDHSARGAIFFMAAVGDVLLTIFLGITGYFYEPITLVALPVIWLIGLVDSFILVDKINMSADINRASGNQMSVFDNNGFKKESNTMSTKVLLSTLMSVVPGLGHMYLGLMKRGIQLMAAFFIAWYFVNSLRVSAFMVLIPIIWAYSVFDAMHKASSEEELQDEGLFATIPGLTKNMSKIIGYILIVVAFIMVFQSVAIPLISDYIGYRLGEYFRTIIIALVFFIGGIKLLRDTKKEDKNTAISESVIEEDSTEKENEPNSMNEEDTEIIETINAVVLADSSGVDSTQVINVEDIMNRIENE